MCVLVPYTHFRLRTGMDGKHWVSYVSNKAGLTGQTVPGRRIPGHWPYLGPDELAETEPVFARGLETCSLFF